MPTLGGSRRKLRLAALLFGGIGGSVGIVIYLAYSLGVFFTSGGPKPDVALASRRVGDLVPGVRNCEAIGRALRARESAHVHGWHAIGTDVDGWVLFLAGEEPFPTRRFLAATWRIDDGRARYVADPRAGVAALRRKMDQERFHSGPETRMEPYDPSWDLCTFRSVDAYRRGSFRGPGRPVPEVGLESMTDEMDHWNSAIFADVASLWGEWRP